MNNMVLLIVLPLILAFLSILLPKLKQYLLYCGIGINVSLLFVLEQGEYALGGFTKPYGITLLLDQYSYIGLVLINILFALAIIVHSEKTKKYSIVLLTLQAGLNGMLLSGDLFNLFVFIEITSISAYILTIQSGKFYDTFHYVIIGSIGSGIYLLGTILIYTSFGSLNISIIASQISDYDALILPLLLIFTGLSVEAKLFPVNGWVKHIYKNANGLVGTLFASMIASTALLVMGRLFNQFYQSSYMILIITIISVLTFISGEIAAYKALKTKEVLLYSSIGQAGLITLLLINGLYFPAMLFITNNALAKFIMFTITDEINPDNLIISKCKGLFQQNNFLGIGFTIASLSSIGLPLFLGFYGKINALIGLFNTNLLLPALVLIMAIVEGAYFIRLNINLWHKSHEGQTSIISDTRKNHSPKLIVTISILALLLVITGMQTQIIDEGISGKPLLNDHVNHYMEGGM
jgi:multicomponent Na+:H+ antiporter subunit D